MKAAVVENEWEYQMTVHAHDTNSHTRTHTQTGLQRRETRRQHVPESLLHIGVD